MMQPFTHAQQLYLNEVQENIRIEMEALKDRVTELERQIEESDKDR